MKNSNKKQRLFIVLSVVGTIIIISCFIWSMQISLSGLSLPTNTPAISESVPNVSEITEEGQNLLETLEEDIEQSNSDTNSSTPEQEESSTLQTSQ